MNPRIITNVTTILLTTKLQEIIEGSVLFSLLRITNSSSGHHRDERPRRENEYCWQNTLHTPMRVEWKFSGNSCQFGGINQALNVLISIAKLSNNCLLEIAHLLYLLTVTSTIGLCYKRERERERVKHGHKHNSCLWFCHLTFDSRNK